MKKLLTTAFAFMLAASFATAQRLVDISVEVVTPAAGATVTDQVPFNMDVKVTNTGPDDIKAGDTLYYFLVIGSQIQNLSRVLTNTDDIPNGSSKTYTVENITIQGSQGGNFNLCALVVLLQRSGVDTVRDNVAGGNNVGCNSVTFANPKGLYDVDAFSSSIYPNPVNGDVATINFSTQEVGEANIRVFDVSGRLVSEQSLNVYGGNEEVRIETNEMKNGVYIYEIKVGETVTRNKFVVNR
ncbi:MAG: T9SS type A sorting domain-containing protein [Bacteroidota bacterium]|nr:T9SS type A sorting domain-containing protein [Bacteroidota bacterium]MDX5429899.1 T9SS type A sorting domain-containing protein [Bacteroidota bacterium]MDX5468673.1 T9SS type A sorting domain-containing protein [Bacteroidota bacterium]